MILVPLAHGEPAGTQSARDAAYAIGQKLRQQMGSPEKLRNDVMNPLLGSGAFDLDTTNDQAAFEVRSACPSSNAFLRISTQLDSGGDLVVRHLEQDLALTGTVDHSIHPGWRVSGVCANGMIECGPGSGFVESLIF